MTEPVCERCGPKGLPVTLIDIGQEGKPLMVCLRCACERERIEPTARKGEKPQARIMAGKREWKP